VPYPIQAAPAITCRVSYFRLKKRRAHVPPNTFSMFASAIAFGLFASAVAVDTSSRIEHNVRWFPGAASTCEAAGRHPLLADQPSAGCVQPVTKTVINELSNDAATVVTVLWPLDGNCAGVPSVWHFLNRCVFGAVKAIQDAPGCAGSFCPERRKALVFYDAGGAFAW
jgi:hypothetical protein